MECHCHSLCKVLPVGDLLTLLTGCCCLVNLQVVLPETALLLLHWPKAVTQLPPLFQRRAGVKTEPCRSCTWAGPVEFVKGWAGCAMAAGRLSCQDGLASLASSPAQSCSSWPLGSPINLLQLLCQQPAVLRTACRLPSLGLFNGLFSTFVLGAGGWQYLVVLLQDWRTAGGHTVCAYQAALLCQICLSCICRHLRVPILLW